MLAGYPITFNIYAESADEAAMAQQAIISFIKVHAKAGRAVTGHKIAQALSQWDSNPLVRNRIINFLKQ